MAPKYLSGDKAGIDEFLSRFDVRKDKRHTASFHSNADE